MDFCDFYELALNVKEYKELFKEDNQRKKHAMGTYFKKVHHDGVQEVVAMVASTGSVVCLKLVKATIGSQ